MLGRIADVVMIAGYWFIHDDIQGKVYQFTYDGWFVRVVGSIGQGPGEYQSISSIAKCYNNQLAILSQGQLLLYDVEGTYLKSQELGGNR